MKSGLYSVTFTINLNDCENEEEAIESMKDAFNEILDKNEFPEVSMELVEQFDIEYETEEDEVQELNF